MNIILEGCDCTGKSTLAELFEKYDGYTIKKFNIPRGKNQLEQYANAKESYYAELLTFKNNSSTLYDRFYLGESIYAPLLRGYSMDYLKDFEIKLNKHRPILAVLHADFDVLKKRFDNQVLKLEQLEYVNNQYINAYKSSLIDNKILLNTTNCTPTDIYCQLKHFICENETYRR